MTALYKKELRAFLSSVIGAVVISVFLLVSGLFHWVFPGQWNLLETGVAELTSFFLFTPWVFLFLIPAITMRSIAEERKNGTLELLLTHPLDPHRIVWAKFLAGTTLVAAALVPTLAGYFVLHQLGNPVGNIDDGSVLAGYFGASVARRSLCCHRLGHLGANRQPSGGLFILCTGLHVDVLRPICLGVLFPFWSGRPPRSMVWHGDSFPLHWNRGGHHF